MRSTCQCRNRARGGGRYLKSSSPGLVVPVTHRNASSYSRKTYTLAASAWIDWNMRPNPYEVSPATTIATRRWSPPADVGRMASAIARTAAVASFKSLDRRSAIAFLVRSNPRRSRAAYSLNSASVTTPVNRVTLRLFSASMSVRMGKVSPAPHMVIHRARSIEEAGVSQVSIMRPPLRFRRARVRARGNRGGAAVAPRLAAARAAPRTVPAGAQRAPPPRRAARPPRRPRRRF